MWYTQETNNPQFTRRGFDKPTPAPIFPCQESPLPLFFFSAHQPCTNTPPSCTKTVKAVLSQTGVLQTINHPTIGDPPWLWKPLWKIWVRQLGWLFPIWWESHRIHAPNHQPETPILWMVAKSCITKRMAETHPKSWDVYHLSTGDLDFATIHRMLVKPVIISHLYVGIIINNRDLYVNPPICWWNPHISYPLFALHGSSSRSRYSTAAWLKSTGLGANGTCGTMPRVFYWQKWGFNQK